MSSNANPTQYKFEITSWKSINFRYTETVSIFDLGYDEESWAELSQSEKEEELDCYQNETLLPRYINISREEVKES